MEERLVHDIKYRLNTRGFSGFHVRKVAARLVVETVTDVLKAAETCADVFGVAYACPAVSVPADRRSVVDSMVEIAEASVAPGQTFAVRAHRAAPTALSRKEIENEGGAAILKALRDVRVKVRLNQPDVTVFAQLAGDRVYVYSKKIPGPGGLPISSQWKMLGILDSGPLSLLAGYAMLRRGCLVELFIPVSDRGGEQFGLFRRERQIRLAKIFRDIIPRESYRSFIFSLDEGSAQRFESSYAEHAELRAQARIAGMTYARNTFYKGVVLADVSGSLKRPFAEVELPPPGTPVFQPLIGLDRDALLDLSNRLGFSNEELRSVLEFEELLHDLKTVPGSSTGSEFEVERISL